MNNNNSLKNLDMLIVINDLIEYQKELKIYDKNLTSYLIFDHVLITTINRVTAQKSKNKKEVLNKLVEYCHTNIGDYKKQKFYKTISKNRKIIAWLNYHKMYNISKIILKVKEKIR